MRKKFAAADETLTVPKKIASGFALSKHVVLKYKRQIITEI